MLPKLLVSLVLCLPLWADIDPGPGWDLRKGGRIFEYLSSAGTRSHELRHQGAIIRSSGLEVSPAYFQALGVRPAKGKLTPGPRDSAVLSHELWQTRFGADPTLVGRTVQLDGRDFLIVGIAEPGFRGHQPNRVTDLWILTQPRS